MYAYDITFILVNRYSEASIIPKDLLSSALGEPYLRLSSINARLGEILTNLTQDIQLPGTNGQTFYPFRAESYNWVNTIIENGTQIWEGIEKYSAGLFDSNTKKLISDTLYLLQWGLVLYCDGVSVNATVQNELRQLEACLKCIATDLLTKTAEQELSDLSSNTLDSGCATTLRFK
jgi:hypothetical protein